MNCVPTLDRIEEGPHSEGVEGQREPSLTDTLSTESAVGDEIASDSEKKNY